VLPWQHWRSREPAFSHRFSVNPLLILHVKSMFGKYRRGVAACMYFLYIYISLISFMPGCAVRNASAQEPSTIQ
jgi:hypothetical protein